MCWGNGGWLGRSCLWNDALGNEVSLNSRRGCRIFFYRWIHDVREISFYNSIWIHIRMWKPAHISLQHLRLFLLLSDEVACFAGPFLRRGCLPHSYLSFYGMDNFFLTIYRVLSVAGIRWHNNRRLILWGSTPYLRFIRHFHSFHFIRSRDFTHSYYIVLVFESFSRRIDHDFAYHERAQRAIHP